MWEPWTVLTYRERFETESTAMSYSLAGSGRSSLEVKLPLILSFLLLTIIYFPLTLSCLWLRATASCARITVLDSSGKMLASTS